jgi:nucleoside 2-deoxyribosyltransferase
MKIYAAGDMHSGWQDALAALLPGHEILDPRSHGLTEPAAYTAWDLDAVRRADVVVVYMTPNNPSGYGPNLEAGYAHGLGKPVIFVDQIGADWRSKYFGMLRSIAMTVVPTLEDAARALIA